MRNTVAGLRRVLVALWVIVIGVLLVEPAWAQRDTHDVLVLDFIGFLAQESDHGRTFQETVLPAARLVSIGIHGIIPDAWRQEAGYDAIIRAGSAKDYERSVRQVSSLITQPQTILAFDVNEHGLPNQLRLAPLLTPNKIYHPALVAARVAEHWLQEHPNGQLILRGHSDGTYAARYIFDYLQKQGRAPAAVILESPRQMYTGWADRAKEAHETLFLPITSTADLSRASVIDRGYAYVPSNKLDNWVNLHVQGWRNPFAAHSIVTAYGNQELKIQRTAASGQKVIEDISLGALVRSELSQFSSRKKPGRPDSSVGHRELPLGEERKKGFPLDPPDQGGGGGVTGGIGGLAPGTGGRSPSGPGHEPSQGIAGVSVAPQPAKAGQGGGELKKEILGSRPSSDQLFWDRAMPKARD